jgi:hypothetical protein
MYIVLSESREKSVVYWEGNVPRLNMGFRLFAPLYLLLRLPCSLSKLQIGILKSLTAQGFISTALSLSPGVF